MLPDNFYTSYGALLTFAFFTFCILILFYKWPRLENADWRLLLTLTLFTNSLDYVSTWFFVSRLGIEHEGNDFMRMLMQHDWYWFAFYKIIVLGGFFALIVLMCQRIKALSAYLWTQNIMFFLTAIHNIVVPLQVIH